MSNSWRSRVGEALVLLLGVAIIARVLVDLLQPIVPGIIVLLGLVVIFALLIRRR